MKLYTGKELESCKEFFGRTIDTMPKLLNEGYLPITVANIMDYCLHPDEVVRKHFHHDCCDSGLDSGDLVFRKPSGETKIWRMPEDPNAAQHILKLINPKMPRRHGSILLTGRNAELYDALTGPDTKTFTPSETKEYFGKRLTVEQTRVHPGWQFLARAQQRLDAFVSFAVEEGLKRPEYNATMDAFLPESDDKAVNVRTWLFYLSYDRTFFFDGLDSNNDRFIGVAPKAQSYADYRNRKIA
jgi:hypothetical protein